MLTMFSMTQIWYQMKGECLSYHMSTKLEPNDYLLTNNSHLYDTTPKCISALKNMYFFTGFLIDTY